MSTLSSKLGLVLPDGTDPVSRVNHLNGNWELLDDAVGTITCTSGTRPATPYAGQLIYESDTRKIMVRNISNTSWTGPINGTPVVNTTADISSPYNGQTVFDLSAWSIKVFRSSTAAWELVPNVQHKFKSANESVTSSTTLQNDDVFSFSVVASAQYELESFIAYDGAADPAGGLKMQFTGPAGCSMVWANYGVNSGGLTTYNVVIEVQSAGSPRSVGTNGATVMSCRPAGSLVTAGTAGTLQFLWAQTASNATATRIYGGSWMRLTRVA